MYVAKGSIKSKCTTALSRATAAGPSSGDWHSKKFYLSVKETAQGWKLRVAKNHAYLADSRTAFGNFTNELKKLKIWITYFLLRAGMQLYLVSKPKEIKKKKNKIIFEDVETSRLISIEEKLLKKKSLNYDLKMEENEKLNIPR
jgi:hypothetical protein